MNKAKILILFLLLTVILISALSGEDYGTGAVPSWVENIEIPSYIPDSEEIFNGEFYLLSDIQVNEVSGEYFNHFALLLSNSTGLENNSQISIDFDPAYEDLTIHRIDIIRNGTRSDRLAGAMTSVIQQEKELEKLLYNGTKSFYAILSDIRIGDILDVSYSVKERETLFSGLNDRFYIEWGVPVRKVYRRIVTDGTSPLTWRTNREIPDPRVIGNGKEYIWEVTDARAVEYEDNVPYWFDAHNYIEVSRYDNWDEVRREIETYYAPLVLDEEQASYILSGYPSLNEASGKKEVAEILLDIVQEEIRYMGIEIGRGSYIPTAPYDVYTRRFGDCKDKTLLLTSLLRKSGIEAYPALVHSSSGKDLINALPGPYQFNHVIAKVIIGEEFFWLDPTSTFQEGRLDRIAAPLYGYALVLSPETAGLEKIGRKFDGTNIVLNETFTLPESIDDAGEYIIETTYYDGEADNMRSWLSNSPPSEIAEEMHEYMDDYYGGLEITGNYSYIDNREDNSITLTEYYSIPGIWEYFGNEDKYQFTYSPYEIYNYTFEPESEERKMPYHLRHPFRIEQNASIRLPGEWNVEETDQEVETDHFLYNQKTSYSEREITLKYVYESKRDSVPAPELGEYAAGIKEISNAIDYIVYWNPEKGEARPEKTENHAGSAAIAVFLAALVIFRIVSRRKKSLDQIH